jgi:ATP-binding cassette subfamily B protein
LQLNRFRECISFVLHTVRVWARERRQSWWSIIRIVPQAGPAVTLAALLNLVIGVLPLAFVVATSVAIDRVPALGRIANDAWGPVLAAMTLAIVVLLLQSALSPFQAAFTELISRRVDGFCTRRLMRCTLAEAPVAQLEQAAVLDKLSDARRGLVEYFVTPGAAAAGLITLIARYAQLLGAAVIVGIVLGPLAAFLIAAAALVARFGNRGSLSRWSVIIDRLSSTRRKMFYIFDTGSELGAAKEIRVLGTLPWWRARADQESDAYLNPLWHERRRIYLGPFIWFSLIVLAGAAAVLVLLRNAAANGGLSVLDLSLAIQAILIPLRFGVFFPEADVQTQYGMLAHDSILQIERAAAAAASLVRSGQRSAHDVPQRAIRFEQVSFAYPGSDRKVLDKVDLEFPAGTSTAIVGLNGAGKTTLVKLLARLYEPTSGRIRLDDTDLDEFDVRSWQRRLAVIYQDYIRYEFDAATNIGLGAPDHMHDLEAIERAAAWAGATEVIDSLPQGLRTVLSSRYQGGTDLSGGQWQRVALARALFATDAGASVLVLDEPTAQLDVRAEVAFFDRFLELTQGLTTVVISHRFSTVRRAQRIVVLEHGRITEQGSHEELLALGGRYAALFELQARRFSAGDETEPEDDHGPEPDDDTGAGPEADRIGAPS